MDPEGVEAKADVGGARHGAQSTLEPGLVPSKRIVDPTVNLTINLYIPTYIGTYLHI
jgi:hypothetical protein